MNDNALHEAGHAIIAEHFGFKVDEVFAHPDPDGMSRLCEIFSVRLNAGHVLARNPVKSEAASYCATLCAGVVAEHLAETINQQKRIDSAAIINIAGDAAEELMNTDSGSAHDLKMLIATLSAATGSSAHSPQFIGEMICSSCKVAAQLCHRYWDNICGLANFLSTGKSCNGDFVRAVAGLSPRSQTPSIKPQPQPQPQPKAALATSTHRGKRYICQMAQADLLGNIRRDQFCEVTELKH